jgi:hypothetical protein
MAVPGWKYLRLGECSMCHEAGAMLYVPVIENAIPIKGRDTVTGEHLPHFEPVCKSCRGRFSLDVLCSTHRLPLLASSAGCRNCFTASRAQL